VLYPEFNGGLRDINAAAFCIHCRQAVGQTGPSALVRSTHDLHGICDVAPFPGFIRIAFHLTGLRVLRSLRNRLETMLLKHLPRDGVNL
jgi:hypothetical protein